MPIVPDSRGPRSLPGERDQYRVVRERRPGVFDVRDRRDDRALELRTVPSTAPWTARSLDHAARVRLPGVRRLVDGGVEGGGLWWVMEAPDRPNLRDLAQSGPLDAVTAARLVCSLGDRLAAIHSAGMVLGALDVEDVGCRSASSCSIPLWTGAPLDGSVDPRIDAMHLGTAWFVALTGTRPRLPTRATPTDLTLVGLAIPDRELAGATTRLIERLLAFDPTKRPHPLGPFLDEVRDLAALLRLERLRPREVAAPDLTSPSYA